MLNTYVPILMMLICAIAFAIVSVVLSKIIGPRNPNLEKLSTYESGVAPLGTAHGRFSIKYYMAAMLFILFDIEIVFMYPWAVSFLKFEQNIRVYSLIEMIVFIVLLFIGYIYMLRKGALKWN
jgi:NADH-quinone oxidoreductase subunit A